LLMPRGNQPMSFMTFWVAGSIQPKVGPWVQPSEWQALIQRAHILHPAAGSPQCEEGR
jgi:hypothetical protein